MTGFIAGMPFLGDLDSNMRVKRLETPRVKVPKGSIGLTEQFTNIYCSTDNEIDAIDEICLKDFIKNLKNIKYLFSSEKELVNFAKKIFKNLNIKYLQINKKYYIKPIYKYDSVLNTTNKTVENLVKELY